MFPMIRAVTLELNELDFELVQQYVRDGHLPTFKRLLESHDLVRTIAESELSNLEPWIQWVTAHTGLTLSQHGVFRLGDIVNGEVPQIWEILEDRFGLHVGAISPMNAKNRLKRPAFFVPDPWTQTAIAGSWDLRLLTEAVVQAVNDNAHNRITLGSYLRLAVGALANVRPENLVKYADLAVTSRTRKWRKALFLDLLLSDAFIRHWHTSKPDYASLFLNAGAHIQHHYMFSSKHYRGPLRNPRWYVAEALDPVEEAYLLYDRILGNVLSALTDVRLLVCTGLSQKPNTRLVHYYRPKQHAEFLRMLGVADFVDVQPRMSRDFLILFKGEDAALAAQKVMESFRGEDGSEIFSVENRGKTLFCMLSYTSDIQPGFSIAGNGRTVERFRDMVSHVSIENAIHRTVGYFLDSGVPKTGTTEPIPLADVFKHTVSIWGTPLRTASRTASS